MPAEKIRNNFIINLKYLLKKEGISSKEFAKKIGVSASTVSMWLCGNSFPRDNVLQKISDFFGISLATLLDKKPQDEKNNDTEKSKNDNSAIILEVTAENIGKNKELFDNIIKEIIKLITTGSSSFFFDPKTNKVIDLDEITENILSSSNEEKAKFVNSLVEKISYINTGPAVTIDIFYKDDLKR